MWIYLIETIHQFKSTRINAGGAADKHYLHIVIQSNLIRGADQLHQPYHSRITSLNMRLCVCVCVCMKQTTTRSNVRAIGKLDQAQNARSHLHTNRPKLCVARGAGRGGGGRGTGRKAYTNTRTNTQVQWLTNTHTLAYTTSVDTLHKHLRLMLSMMLWVCVCVFGAYHQLICAQTSVRTHTQHTRTHAFMTTTAPHHTKMCGQRITASSIYRGCWIKYACMVRAYAVMQIRPNCSTYLLKCYMQTENRIHCAYQTLLLVVCSVDRKRAHM